MSEFIFGRNTVLEALRSNRPINKILIAKGMKKYPLQEILFQTRQKKIVIDEVERKKLDVISKNSNHQGILAFTSPKEYANLDEILKEKNELTLLILDKILDPHNFGAILRSAEAAAVDCVIISKRNQVGLTSTVAKVSSGALEYVPVARVSNLAQTIDILKGKNIFIVGLDPLGKSYFKEKFKGSIALVVGGEGKGLGRLIKEKCDILVSIPMKGKLSSLNASVSISILLYEILRQKEEN